MPGPGFGSSPKPFAAMALFRSLRAESNQKVPLGYSVVAVGASVSIRFAILPFLTSGPLMERRLPIFCM